MARGTEAEYDTAKSHHTSHAPNGMRSKNDQVAPDDGQSRMAVFGTVRNIQREEWEACCRAPNLRDLERTLKRMGPHVIPPRHYLL